VLERDEPSAGSGVKKRMLVTMGMVGISGVVGVFIATHLSLGCSPQA
jgi:hypothetical protein